MCRHVSYPETACCVSMSRSLRLHVVWLEFIVSSNAGDVSGQQAGILPKVTRRQALWKRSLARYAEQGPQNTVLMAVHKWILVVSIGR